MENITELQMAIQHMAHMAMLLPAVICVFGAAIYTLMLKMW